MKKKDDVVGNVYRTTKSGDALVIQCCGRGEVLVRFLNTGFEKSVSLKYLKLGKVLDPTAKRFNLLGEFFQTKNGGVCKIVEYVSSREVLVEFECGYKKWCEYSQLKNGNVKNPYSPTVEGVGYIGEGDYSEPSKTKEGFKAYQLWQGVLERCYNESVRCRYPTYKKCSVVEGWKNFNVFASWCVEQKGFFEKDKNGKVFHLDKDILVKGNKVYSPETCCFVPREINNLILSADNVRGSYPLGVYYDKKVGKFKGQMNCEGSQKHLGYFDTPEEAFLAYKQAKECHIKQIAEKWKGSIDFKVYQALLNYETNVED